MSYVFYIYLCKFRTLFVFFEKVKLSNVLFDLRIRIRFITNDLCALLTNLLVIDTKTSAAQVILIHTSVQSNLSDNVPALFAH